MACAAGGEVVVGITVAGIAVAGVPELELVEAAVLPGVVIDPIRGMVGSMIRRTTTAIPDETPDAAFVPWPFATTSRAISPRAPTAIPCHPITR
jgi:hypothetical protein